MTTTVDTPDGGGAAAGARRRPSPHPSPVPSPEPPAAEPADAQVGAQVGAPVGGGTPRRSRAWPTSPWQWRLFLVAVGALTFGLHVYRIDTSIDLFVDESFYSEVGQSVAQGHMPYATGSLFFLHPPGFFVLEAAWMKVFGLHAHVFAQVFSLRKLVAVIAGLTAVALALVVERAVGRVAAVVAAVVYAMNAFANRDSTIVILEPATLLFALAGYALFLRLGPAGTRRRTPQVLLAGLLFGCSILCKEFAVFVTLLPLGIAFVLGIWLTRREALLAAAAACVPYAIWLVIVVHAGDWSVYLAQITSGFHRTTGATQISGFNRPGAPSFLDAIITNLAYLWTAYAVLGLGTIAIVYLAVRRSTPAPLRFVSLFGVGALPLLAYSVTLGTNEEQFFVFLFFPALICLIAVVWREWHRLAGVLQFAAVLLVAGALISDYSEYVITHAEPDNGTYRVDAWLAAHVPDGTVVAVTNPVQREVLLRYTMVDDAPNTRLDPDVRYLVVFSKQVDQGYAFVDRVTVDRQTRGHRQVFSFSDRSNGRMSIYAIR